MLGWSSPRRTSISPHTELSLPLTFFLGMTLSATSTVSSSSVGVLLREDGFEKGERWDDAVLRLEPEGVRDMEGLELVGGAAVSPAAAAPLRATLAWPGGTCHVAR